jgi:isoleucyl-tRNA synthetase
VLDTATTPDLESEGLARDLVRAVQDTRKAAQLDVSDRISLTLYFGSRAEATSIEPFVGVIAQETLAEKLQLHSADSLGESVGSVDALAALHGTVDAYRSLVAAGQYANSDDVLVELTITGAGTDV